MIFINKELSTFLNGLKYFILNIFEIKIYILISKNKLITYNL